MKSTATKGTLHGVMNRIRRGARNRAGDTVYDTVAGTVANTVANTVAGTVGDRVGDAVRSGVGNSGRSKIRKLVTGMAAVAVVFSLAGCGSSASANTTGQASAAQTGQAAQNATGSGFRRDANFKPTFVMKTNPTSLSAGKQFTMTFSMQFANRSPRTGHPGYMGPRTGNSVGAAAGSTGNRTGGYRGGYGGGNRIGNRTGGPFGGTPPTGTVQIFGNGVNQTIGLSNQNRAFSGTTTLANPGTDKVTLTVQFGSRSFTQQFTIKVAQ
ncbi:hypothetical protein [Alicyclobacillus ferrooxydans]|uniref:Uncharacterized protein n=1 Tax=Alicyclobacillus ferrooxydans TaxID=471514 RepID=A0A0P9EUW0_9BACL|nr:hypothetical protein [Alicyclobacillus ferrooxydans]KPV42760.1 hypothetical protein AN477_15520 [Alicyclobacillus ferrooxydans]